MDNIFEQASRLNLHIQTEFGLQAVHELWSIKPKKNAKGDIYHPLDQAGHEIARALQSYEQSSNLWQSPYQYNSSKTKTQSTLELKLAILTRILEVQRAEQEEAFTNKANKDHNAKIDQLIAAKKEESLTNLSIEQLEALRK